MVRKATKKKSKTVKRKSKSRYMKKEPAKTKPLSQQRRDLQTAERDEKFTIAMEQLAKLKLNPAKCPRCNVPGIYKGDEFLKTVGKTIANGKTPPYYAYFNCRRCSLRFQEIIDPTKRSPKDNKFYHSAKPKLWEPIDTPAMMTPTLK